MEDTFQDPKWMPENAIGLNTIYTMFYPYIYTLFSLAYLNCQYHCSCPVGPLLRKRSVTWIQALRYFDGGSSNSAGFWVTNGQVASTSWRCCTKWQSTSQAGWTRAAQDFITILSTAHNLKTYEWFIFWNFSFILFRPRLTTGSWKHGNSNRG